MFWPTAGMFCSVLVAHMLFCLLQVAACTKNTKSSLDESEHKSSTNNLERVLLTINFNRDQFAIRSLLVITDKEAVQFYLLVFFWTIKWVEFTNKNVPFFFFNQICTKLCPHLRITPSLSPCCLSPFSCWWICPPWDPDQSLVKHGPPCCAPPVDARQLVVFVVFYVQPECMWAVELVAKHLALLLRVL